MRLRNERFFDVGVFSGDIGTIVHVYPDGEAFEVEFETFECRGPVVLTVERDDIAEVR